MATLKQKAVAEKIVENHGNISKTMLEVGYDPTTAKNPKNLTESKGWQELMEDYLPDNILFTKHQEALDATKWNDFTGEREEDHGIRLKAIVEAHKLKGRNKDGLNIQGDLNMSVTIVRNAVE